jgi:hypothetical protein
LTFLRSKELVALVEDLDRHPSLGAALEASAFTPQRWPVIRRALARLEASEVICAR